MNATQLLEHFDRLAEAPNAVPRLRRFILNLAVRGKLVAQDAGDELAGELLKRIQAERFRALNMPVKRDTLLGAEPESTDIQLPVGWVWSKLGNLCTKTGSGSTPAGGKDAYVSSGVPFLRSQNVYDDGLRLEGVAFISDATQKRMSSTTVKAGDLLLNITGGSIGRCAIVPDSFVIGNINQHVAIIRLALLESGRFLHSVICSDYFQKHIFGNQTGAGREGLPKNRMDEIPIPVAPLAEQHRIVAKVDELMALCDQLEAAQQERERRRDRLAAASLQRLNQPEVDSTSEAQREHARFHLQNLPRLTTRPEHIKAMRQNIRSLAVCGRLLPQDPRDQSAAEFLKEVAADRDTLEKMGEIREAKSLNSIDLEVVPFPLPKDWEWARFGELINHSDAGISPKTEGFARSGDQWGVLKVSAVSWDRFRPEENKQLFEGLVPPDFAHVQAGDFLISRANTRELVAKCVIVNEKPVKLILSDKTVRLRLTSLGHPRFWCLVNNYADYARAYYAEEASGTSDSMKNVSRSVIYNLLMPIPPLAEQRRIVAKVDELMALCDQLEAQLTTTQTDSRRLLEAVLETVLISEVNSI